MKVINTATKVKGNIRKSRKSAWFSFRNMPLAYFDSDFNTFCNPTGYGVLVVRRVAGFRGTLILAEYTAPDGSTFLCSPSW